MNQSPRITGKQTKYLAEHSVLKLKEIEALTEKDAAKLILEIKEEERLTEEEGGNDR